MNQDQRLKTTKKVCFISGLINFLLGIIKIFIGYTGRSQALVADGLHSLSDVVTDILVYVAAHFGAKAPDREHPYGHRRLETIATIAIALLLILVAFEMAKISLTHLFSDDSLALPSYLVLLTAAASGLINEALYRYCRRKGNQIKSRLLLSNAWHNRGDALASILVLAGAGGAYLGYRFMDPIAAIIIAIWVAKIAIDMISASCNELIDAAVDSDTLTLLNTTIAETPGVLAQHQLRTREHSHLIFIDCHILVDPFISVSEGHYIGEHVRKRLLDNHTSIADVTVHIDSEDDDLFQHCLALPDRSTIEAQLHTALATAPGYQERTRLTIHYVENRVHLELQLPATLLATHTVAQLKQSYHDLAKSLDNHFTITLSLST